MEEKLINGSRKERLIPRNLHVYKFVEPRASELEALHSIISNRLNGDFRSQRSKRRRTTSHYNNALRKRKNKRRRLESDDPNLKKDEKKAPRKIRRRIEFKMNSETGFSASGDGTKRLRTHVWHAKRFTMTKLWGFHLPLGLQGRGKGSRALLKRYKSGVLVHDASYHVAIQVEGPEDALMSALRMVLVPSILSPSQDTLRAIISGDIYGRAILHHVGAPASNAIGPVTYMWRPYHCQNKVFDPVNHTSSIYKRIDGTNMGSTVRQLWVWVHASSFSEGFDALRLACQKEMDERNIPIYCTSLEGQLAKLEVFGSKAFQLLQTILHPITCTSQSLWLLKKHTACSLEDNFHVKKTSNLENEDSIPYHGIVSIICEDPRIMSEEKKIAFVQESASMHKSDAFSVTWFKEPDISSNNEELSSQLDSRVKRDTVFPVDKELWDVGSGVSPPMEDSVLCAARHQAWVNHFCLDEPCGDMPRDLSPLQCLRTCPILLLKENDKTGSLIRWSILLPISWVKAFWIPLVTSGASAIGLRERHWMASEVGLPSFPWDFPDCATYLQFMAKEAAVADNRSERSTPATRPFKIPIPPPWHTVQVTLSKGPDGVESHGVSSEKNLASVKLSSSFYDGNINITLVGDHRGKSFDGVVARTSSLLTDFLNRMHLCHLPLFPQGQDKKSRILEFLNKKSALDRCENSNNHARQSRKLCFLRVLLHAYKEGVFEEGAVICAPDTSDISLWMSRSEDSERGLQIPESDVRCYFKEQSSAIWELQLPEDAVARESHRWPIGFVTTGFVRGSKKPVGEGFCEATLLASLREQQWEGMIGKQKEEIYVLVRNLRSSAYRLALATIFLEQNEDDLEFM